MPKDGRSEIQFRKKFKKGFLKTIYLLIRTLQPKQRKKKKWKKCHILIQVMGVEAYISEKSLYLKIKNVTAAKELVIIVHTAE